MPGDCYMWGSSGRAAGGSSNFVVPTGRLGLMDRADSGSTAAAAAAAASSWQSSAAPTLLDGTTHLDVASVRGNCRLMTTCCKRLAVIMTLA